MQHRHDLLQVQHRAVLLLFTSTLTNTFYTLALRTKKTSDTKSLTLAYSNNHIHHHCHACESSNHLQSGPQRSAQCDTLSPTVTSSKTVIIALQVGESTWTTTTTAATQVIPKLVISGFTRVRTKTTYTTFIVTVLLMQ